MGRGVPGPRGVAGPAVRRDLTPARGAGRGPRARPGAGAGGWAGPAMSVRQGRLGAMSHSPRRACPACGRDCAVTAGRIARHDPPGGSGRGDLVSCPGSRARVVLGASAPTLDGFVLSEHPGQLPLF